MSSPGTRGVDLVATGGDGAALHVALDHQPARAARQLVVHALLDAGQAGVVDPDLADQRPAEVAGRVEPLLLLEQQHAVDVERLHLVGDVVRDLARQVHEAAGPGQVGAEPGLVEPEHRGQAAGRAGGVGDDAGVGRDRGLGDGDGEVVAVAVEDRAPPAGELDRLDPLLAAVVDVAVGRDHLDVAEPDDGDAEQHDQADEQGERTRPGVAAPAPAGAAGPAGRRAGRSGRGRARGDGPSRRGAPGRARRSRRPAGPGLGGRGPGRATRPGRPPGPGGAATAARRRRRRR